MIISGLSKADQSYLTVYSSPNDVEIRLDSVLVGSTPLDKIEIAPGKHRLEALSPYSGLWNMTNIVKEFEIKAGQDTAIHIRFEKQVQINSIPYGAQLMFQNRSIGATPVSVPFEPNKGKEFRLEKPGYRTQQFVLKKPEPYIITLEPLNMELVEETNHSFSHALFHTRLKSKFLFLTGTVVTHWLSFYFKNVADDNYNKYAQTGDPHLMNKYWDKTQKYDRLSDITLGVSYAFLSGLIYTVLWR